MSASDVCWVASAHFQRNSSVRDLRMRDSGVYFPSTCSVQIKMEQIAAYGRDGFTE